MIEIKTLELLLYAKISKQIEKSDNRRIINANIEPQNSIIDIQKKSKTKKICVKMSCKKFSKYLPSFRS